MLSLFFSSSISHPLKSKRVDCYKPLVLAPEEDCRDILRNLVYLYSQNDQDIRRIWGRSIVRTDPYDLTRIPLPFGFRLERMRADPELPPNLCEIHVDNVVGKEDQPDLFNIADMGVMGYDILDQCYPEPRHQTGKAYPGQVASVYFTTLKLPDLRGTEWASNETAYDVVYLKEVNLKPIEIQNVTTPYSLASKPIQTISTS